MLSIYDYCDGLEDFPFRGHAQDNLTQGMRVIRLRRRAMIAFLVTDNKVEIHGVYYGGNDYETLILRNLN